MSGAGATSFRYEDLPVFDSFERVSDPTVYTALPDDWQVGAADVVRSTDALAAGRYKAVNLAGAAVVAAVRNALGERAFPFVFGGDGAVLAVPGDSAAATAEAMKATRNFVAADLQLELRVGMVAVRDIRAAGRDMRVARYGASPIVDYAMFAGGGASWTEAELKAGRIALPDAPADARPNLEGLSCRWAPIESRHGVMLSVLMVPAAGFRTDAFRNLAGEVVRMTGGANPVPPEGPRFAVSGEGIGMEARATRRRNAGRLLQFLQVGATMVIAKALDLTNRKAGGFDPKHYRSWVARNTDFRKFDDGLRMTIDCTLAEAEALEAKLAAAHRAGIVEYGVHRQDAALMTCIVPSPFQDDHVHFLDGAGGGYALASRAMKARIAARENVDA